MNQTTFIARKSGRRWSAGSKWFLCWWTARPCPSAPNCPKTSGQSLVVRGFRCRKPIGTLVSIVSFSILSPRLRSLQGAEHFLVKCRHGTTKVGSGLRITLRRIGDVGAKRWWVDDETPPRGPDVRTAGRHYRAIDATYAGYWGLRRVAAERRRHIAGLGDIGVRIRVARVPSGTSKCWCRPTVECGWVRWPQLGA